MVVSVSFRRTLQSRRIWPGRRKKTPLPPNPSDSEPLPKLDTANAVKDVASRLFADLHARKLPPKLATDLASLLNLQLRVIHDSEIEQHIARLEQGLVEVQKASDEAKEKQNVTH
jgi:hypothetical protein